MRIQCEILLLTCLALSTSVASKAQKLTEDAPPVKKKTALKVPKGMWLSLSAATYIAAAFDMHATADAEEWFKKHPNYYRGPTETDPLARPFVRLSRPAYYAAALPWQQGSIGLVIECLVPADGGKFGGCLSPSRLAQMAGDTKLESLTSFWRETQIPA